MNTIMITGNLTEDPQITFTTSGKAVGRLTIADNENRRKPDGTWEQVGVTFWRCTLFGKQAENVAELRKGAQVVATGRAKTSTWETDEGEKRSALEVIISAIGVVPRDTANPPSTPANDPWGGAQRDPNEAPF